MMENLEARITDILLLSKRKISQWETNKKLCKDILGKVDGINIACRVINKTTETGRYSYCLNLEK